MDLVLLKPGNQELFAEMTGSLIDGELIGGENPEELEGCMELVSCNFGMQQQMTTDVSNSARTSGRPNLHDITIVKYLDKASPRLYQACLGAQPIDEGEDEPTKIFLCRNSNYDGDDNIIAPIMTISLWNCMVSSVQAQSHPNDMATEQLTLNFTDIAWSAAHQDSQANTVGFSVAQWSVRRNRLTSFAIG
jgi:type VI secretion system secreted protein Hcp